MLLHFAHLSEPHVCINRYNVYILKHYLKINLKKWLFYTDRLFFIKINYKYNISMAKYHINKLSYKWSLKNMHSLILYIQSLRQPTIMKLDGIMFTMTRLGLRKIRSVFYVNLVWLSPKSKETFLMSLRHELIYG